MLRYVILYHEMPLDGMRPSHWDVMLEENGSLLTWAIGEEPAAGKSLEADQLPDHRLDYLTYEGPISNQRGSVRRWDAGEYRIARREPSHLTVELIGQRLRCAMQFVRPRDDGQRWTVSLFDKVDSAV